MCAIVTAPASSAERAIADANALLSGLSVGARTGIVRAAHVQKLRTRQRLYDQDSPLTRVYFPLRGFTSLMVELEDGTQVETASIGPEGMIGVSLALGTKRHAAAAVVRANGAALTVSGPAMLSLMETHPDVRSTVLGWTAALMSDIEVALGCVAHHSILQRLARWIGAAESRIGTQHVLEITHEELAQCIGAQRPSVSEAAIALQRADAIQYRRGQLRILDRAPLDRIACGCNRAISWTPAVAARPSG